MPSQKDLSLSDQWENIVKAVVPKALEIAAQTTAALAEQYIPVKENALRNSKEIEIQGGEVELRYGDGLPYAKFQYEGSEDSGEVNHLADSKGRPIRMVNYLPARRRSGRGAGAYSAAYQAAQEAGALTTFKVGGSNDPRWIHRTIENGRAEKKIQDVFVKALKGT